MKTKFQPALCPARGFASSLALLLLSSCGLARGALPTQPRTPPLQAVAAVSPVPSRFEARALDVTVGGQHAVLLKAPPRAGRDSPRITEAVILPGRGMNILKLKAHLPGRSEDVDLLVSQSLEDTKRVLDAHAPEDFNGNLSFKSGGAILLPFANRIRGKLDAAKREIETRIAGRAVRLPANWKGQNPGAEPNAMHGLILDRPMTRVSLNADDHAASVEAFLDAGDFHGHWPASALVLFRVTLADSGLFLSVTTRNPGKEPLPLGVGWHPYFAFPSGDRTQARLHVPATRRALVNNYDDVFPTGRLVPVKGTPYDFTPQAGRALGGLFLDDTFTGLQRGPHDTVSADVIDPKAGLHLRLTSRSPEVKAYQVYAPPEKAFVVVEPQFNLGDPFGREWPRGTDTGMASVPPGGSATYDVRVELLPER